MVLEHCVSVLKIIVLLVYEIYMIYVQNNARYIYISM